MHQALTVLMHSERHRLIRLDNAGACLLTLGGVATMNTCSPPNRTSMTLTCLSGRRVLWEMPAETKTLVQG